MSGAVLRLVLLVLLMAGTRFNHIGSALHLPDASWAVFFLAGLYLRDFRKWVLPALLIEAVVIDCVAVQYLGVSNYCLTVAYWFIVPAYGALWLGGARCRHLPFDLRGAGVLGISLFASVSLCFLLTNGSFYWLGGRVVGPDWTGWMQNFGDWYFTFLKIPFVYVGAAAAVHLLLRSPGGAATGPMAGQSDNSR